MEPACCLWARDCTIARQATFANKQLSNRERYNNAIRSLAARIMSTSFGRRFRFARVEGLFGNKPAMRAKSMSAGAVIEDGRTSRGVESKIADGPDAGRSWRVGNVNQSPSECVVSESFTNKPASKVTCAKLGTAGRRLRSRAPGHPPHPFMCMVYSLCVCRRRHSGRGLETSYGSLFFGGQREPSDYRWSASPAPDIRMF